LGKHVLDVEAGDTLFRPSGDGDAEDLRKGLAKVARDFGG
jgi:hypothetical protein